MPCSTPGSAPTASRSRRISAAPPRTCDAGVALGANDDRAQLAADAAAFVALGYRSLKLKIAPGHDVDPVAAVRAEVGPDVVLQVDANGSYTLADSDVLAGFDELGVACLEQPLAPDALLDHARLATRLRTPIGLDETIVSERIARDAIELGACTVVSIKTALVGGIDAARGARTTRASTRVSPRAPGECSRRVSVAPR